MIIKRFAAAALALCLGVMLSACTPFSGVVADHWPHWAGGLPSDAPPRPGAPGYDEFMAHQQQGAVSVTGDLRPTATDQNPAPTSDQPAAANQKSDAQARPGANRAPGASNTVESGLY